MAVRNGWSRNSTLAMDSYDSARLTISSSLLNYIPEVVRCLGDVLPWNQHP